MATLTAQATTTAGINPTMVAADALGDSVANNGTQIIEITTTTVAVVVTFVAQGACNHGSLHNVPVTIGTGATRRIGPFKDTSRWNDTNGKLQWTYDQVVGVTVGVRTY